MAYTDIKIDQEKSYRRQTLVALSGSSEALSAVRWERFITETKYEFHKLTQAEAEAGAQVEAAKENTSAVAKYTGKATWWQIDCTNLHYGEWTKTVE